MKTWYLACAVEIVLALSGCRAGRPQLELEREARWLEDRVDQLQYELRETQLQLASCQRENRSLLRDTPQRSEAKHPVKGTRRSSRNESGDGETDEAAPPQVEIEMPGSGQVPPYEEPLVSPPDPNVPDGERASPEPADSGPEQPSVELPEPRAAPTKPPARLPRYDQPAGERAEPFHEKTAGADQVMKITLNRKLTGGHDTDGQPGDDGLMVVVEPLDAEGQLVEVPGKVSVVVLDPALEGAKARVARWDFEAAEAVNYLKRTAMGDGLHFTLPWPHDRPTNRELHLYVRYVTPDGRKLEADRTIRVRLAGDSDQQWTRSTQPPDDSDDAADAERPPRARATAVRPTRAQRGATKAPRTTRRRAGGSGTSGTAPRWSPYR